MTVSVAIVNLPAAAIVNPPEDVTTIQYINISEYLIL